tara:strand:- start:88 stop:840 length:753 start_codon:yes stop_codon:yes gene_type:complete
MKKKYLPFIKSKKILNIDNNAKTVKGQKKGYKTAMFYGAPADESGFNVCPMASPGCKKACLYTAGHGAFSNVKEGRINKTRWLIQEPETFLKQFFNEIKNFIINCEKGGFIPCLRPNGTSDIAWEHKRHEGKTIFETFPNLIIYDYTKVYKRQLKFINGEMPKNYHLTFSLDEENQKEAFKVLKAGGNIAAVFRKFLPETFKGFNVINGDENDLRFLNKVKKKVGGLICGLVAKGKAKTDFSGFVLDAKQ